jgi:hypothetical protein
MRSSRLRLDLAEEAVTDRTAGRAAKKKGLLSALFYEAAADNEHPVARASAPSTLRYENLTVRHL